MVQTIIEQTIPSQSVRITSNENDSKEILETLEKEDVSDAIDHYNSSNKSQDMSLIVFGNR